jgi:surfeit locus 1 family protein
MLYRTIEVRGRYDTGLNILLDNQVHDGVAGYWVYTPLALDGEEAYILVNRGWVPAGSDRRVPPRIETPPGVVTLPGMAALPPAPGMVIEEDVPESLAPGFVRLQRLEMARLMLEYGGKLFPYELRLDPKADSGFVRAWKEPGTGSERHLGYAYQWFAMAAAVVILFLLLNIRRAGDEQ